MLAFAAEGYPPGDCARTCNGTWSGICRATCSPIRERYAAPAISPRSSRVNIVGTWGQGTASALIGGLEQGKNPRRRSRSALSARVARGAKRPAVEKARNRSSAQPTASGRSPTTRSGTESADNYSDRRGTMPARMIVWLKADALECR